MSEDQIRAWLLGYAWLGSLDEQAREVECILAQDGWRHVGGVADQFAGAQEEPGPAAVAAGSEYALSALYECHDGPHLPSCPSGVNESEVNESQVNQSESVTDSTNREASQ